MSEQCTDFRSLHYFCIVLSSCATTRAGSDSLITALGLGERRGFTWSLGVLLHVGFFPPSCQIRPKDFLRNHFTFGSENRCSLNSPAHPSGLDGPNSSPSMQDCIFTMFQLFFCLKNLLMISLFLDFSFIWGLVIMEWELTEVPGNLITSIQDTTGILFWFLYSLFCFFVANLFSFFLLGLSVDVVAAKIEPRLANTLIR